MHIGVQRPVHMQVVAGRSSQPKLSLHERAALAVALTDLAAKPFGYVGGYPVHLQVAAAVKKGSDAAALYQEIFSQLGTLEPPLGPLNKMLIMDYLEQKHYYEERELELQVKPHLLYVGLVRDWAEISNGQLHRFDEIVQRLADEGRHSLPGPLPRSAERSTPRGVSPSPLSAPGSGADKQSAHAHTQQLQRQMQQPAAPAVTAKQATAGTTAAAAALHEQLAPQHPAPSAATTHAAPFHAQAAFGQPSPTVQGGQRVDSAIADQQTSSMPSAAAYTEQVKQPIGSSAAGPPVTASPESMLQPSAVLPQQPYATRSEQQPLTAADNEAGKAPQLAASGSDAIEQSDMPPCSMAPQPAEPLQSQASLDMMADMLDGKMLGGHMTAPAETSSKPPPENTSADAAPAAQTDMSSARAEAAAAIAAAAAASDPKTINNTAGDADAERSSEQLVQPQVQPAEQAAPAEPAAAGNIPGDLDSIVAGNNNVLASRDLNKPLPDPANGKRTRDGDSDMPASKLPATTGSEAPLAQAAT